MVFLLIVGVNFGRRRRFVRRNKSNFTSFHSAVKHFFVRHSKNNLNSTPTLPFKKYFL
jgi:hypothetical protein